MNVWEALILGIVQGLTEFLPVSSSGHLEIVKYLLGDQSTGEQGLMMTVVLHFATACATIFVFRKEIWSLMVDGFSLKRNESNTYIFLIGLSMIPAVLVGLTMEDTIEAFFNQNLLLVGSALLVTALLLIFADRATHTQNTVQGWNAFLIGIAQAIAILPGISRSGATISTAVLLKVDRDKAARFSFLMVVPLIFGKMAKDWLDSPTSMNADRILPLLAGFATAFVFGVIACKWMVLLVRRANLRYFGWYCAVIGIFCLLWVNWK